MRSILAILLLGLGLSVLRYASKLLVLNLIFLATSYSIDNLSGTMIRWLDIVMTIIDVGFFIAVVALGKHLLGRQREKGAELRQ